MNVLFWVFGFAALSTVLPVLFHLIQRTPQGRQAFSSLMFLRPVPPRFTKRSRINNWLLLLLRILALLLITAAFMRPFLSGNLPFAGQVNSQRRIAILLDVSASMRRETLWSQAVAKTRSLLEQLEPGDDFAILTFSEKVQPLVGLAEQPPQDLASKRTLALKQLEEIRPTWGQTHLGQAINQAIEMLQTSGESGVGTELDSPPKLQIELISDLTLSADIEVLRQSEWPESVRLRPHVLPASTSQNASVQILLADETQDDRLLPRARLRSYDAQNPIAVEVQWTNGSGNELTSSEQLAVQLAPLGSQSLELATGKFEQAEHYRLVGDAHDFDNHYYVAPREPLNSRIWILSGRRLDDPANPMFYLQRALVDTPSRSVETELIAPGTLAKRLLDSEQPHLIFVEREQDPADILSLQQFVGSGGTVQWCLTSAEAARQAVAIFSELKLKEEGESVSPVANGYQLLVDLDFRHPLLRVFAHSTFNDFTALRVWNHLPLELTGSEHTHLLASFDNGAPALWVAHPTSSQSSDSTPGNWVISNFGWHPDNSQLAMSSKFVIWVNQLVDWVVQPPPISQGFLVNSTINVDQWLPEAIQVEKPDGAIIPLESRSGFSQTDIPGLYTVTGSSGQWRFAVNLDRSESEIRTMELSVLESLGILLGTHPTHQQELQALKTKHHRETEAQQKLWKWLLLAAIAILLVESIWAARLQWTAERTLNNLATGG